MSAKTALVALVVLAASCGADAQENRAGANEKTQMQFAERVAMIEVARKNSLTVRMEREKCPMVGPESGALLLSIGTIGCGRTDAATAALLNLIGLQLDGGSSEELTCQFWARGETIIPRLKALDAASIANSCRVRFEELRAHELRQVEDVSADRVCRTSQEISQRRDYLLGAVREARDCGH